MTCFSLNKPWSQHDMTKATGEEEKSINITMFFVNKTIWLFSSAIVFAGFNNEITQVAFGIRSIQIRDNTVTVSLSVTQTPQVLEDRKGKPMAHLLSAKFLRHHIIVYYCHIIVSIA